MSILSNFFNKRSAANPEAEMGFVEHIEALRWHIFRAIIALAIGAILAFINIEFIFDKIILGPTREDFVSYTFLCELGKMTNIDGLCPTGNIVRFQNTKLTGQFMLSFSSAAMFGFILAFPYIFWEFWRFIKPALKENERRNARGLVFWGSLLFLLGVCFSYFIMVPFAVSFFSQYVLSKQFENIITIADYYDTVSNLILGVGFVFELPILVYFLSKIGLLTPAFLQRSRRYAIVILLFISAIITPPDWFSIFLVFLPLYSLYELSIVVSARINKKYRKQEEERDLDW